MSEIDLSAGIAFGGNSECALNLIGSRRYFKGRIAKEGADGGEANIAAARADTTLLFQIVEKRADNWCIDIFEQQTWPAACVDASG